MGTARWPRSWGSGSVTSAYKAGKGKTEETSELLLGSPEDGSLGQSGN